jgi:hypothetical protein
MTDGEMKVSWAHHKKWMDWKPLSSQECHELFSYQDSDQIVLPAFPQITQVEDHEITEVRVVSASLDLHQPSRRRHPRFMAKIPVEIMVGANKFPTHTSDLSEGGFCFEDKLPDWVAGYFTVVLNASGKMFEFTCFLAEDQKKDKFRAEVAPACSEKVIDEFRDWLVAQKFPEVPLRY